MNYTRKITLILFLSIGFIGFCQQNLYYESYNWNKEPIKDFDIEKHQDKELVALLEKNISEFYFIDEGLVEYLLIHKIFWLNSNDAIEDYNKVYLPSYYNSELVKNKARVITREGKILELDDSKILTSTDNETQTTYKYYAMEGVEKGGFIEYLYVVKKYPSYTGKTVFLQGDYFKKEFNFEVFAPTNLKFKFKTYNDSTQVQRDTLVKDKKHWKLNLKNIPVLEKEEKSAYDTELKQVVFKLDKNLSNPTKEIVSFGNVSQNLYEKYYASIDKKEVSKLKKIFSELKIKKGDDKELNIRKLENYIKSKIYITKSKVDANADNISSILEAKVASEKGVLKLFIAALDILEIPHELVITANRNQYIIDPEMETYNVLINYLLFIPSIEKYLEPVNYSSRFGFPNGYLTDTNGLFIKRVKIGDFESAIGEVKYIKPVNYDKSAYNLKMNLSFDKEDITNTKIDLVREMLGYYAMSMQPFIQIMKPKNKEEVLNGVIKSIKEEVTIQQVESENDDPKDFGYKPLKIKATLNSSAFVQNAGNKFLFKVGELIGPQLEMYQEQERQLKVSDDFERSYFSEINVEIPEGYEFKNLEKLNISETFSQEDDNILFTFDSSYKIEKNHLQISIKEFYNKNIIPVSLYENYRKVINSAANFNKISLVLVKK